MYLNLQYFTSQAGHSIHIGGLIRLDVEELSVDTIYITVWASSLLPLHMGKTENASAMMENHFGLQLQVYLIYYPNIYGASSIVYITCTQVPCN